MRKGYPTDLTDKAWAILAPLIPPSRISGFSASPAAGRKIDPSAGMIDSPSIKAADCVEERGFDAGKKIKGRKKKRRKDYEHFPQASEAMIYAAMSHM